MKPGDLIAGRFSIERRASAGAMGAVYRAVDRTSGRAVALKALHQPSVGYARFEREAEVLAGLEHPGIVRYVAHGLDDDGEGWLAIEWLDGIDLAARLHGPRLGIGESVALARRVAEALGAAHARGVLHRDVKPSNIFLVGGAIEGVKVVDFGIARLEGATSGTRTGTALGTPGYMAPEQARGARDVDARADVFALGCVLFECLAGRPVFAGEHVMAILAKVLLEEAPRVRELRAEVPAPLDALLARMLSKTPDARPRDGNALAGEMAAIADLDLDDGGGPLSSLALGSGEQRLLCVVLAGRPPERLGTEIDARAALADTMSQEVLAAERGSREAEAQGAEERVQRELGHFGANIERLVGGSIVATLSGIGSATERASQAARFALAVRALLPEIPMALATGRGWAVTERFPVGEVIDRAVALIRADLDDEPRAEAQPASAARPRPIRLDDATAGLLDVRFEVGGDASGLALHAEREQVEATRTLLGKATPCVGREREISVLLGLFDECASEPVPRAVLITAAAGVGKSRLRFELVRKLKEQNPAAEVWMCRGDPMGAGSPFGLVAPAIRRAAGIYDGEPLGVRRQKILARVGRHLAGDEHRRTAEFLGELVGAPFPDDDSIELRAARRDAMLMGDQMRRAFEAFLAAECDAAPLVLVLENLQWGDLPSVQFVDAALRGLENKPLLVVAIGRPDVHEVFPKLWEERALYELRLPDLTKRASEKLVRAVLGDAAPAATVERVVAQAAGNAFFLEELIRAVAAGKGDALPETVLAMVEARLERIDPSARRVLRAASVFGQVFWQGGVAALLGGALATADLDGVLADLVEQEILARRPEARFPEQTEYIFRHALVREAAHAMLTDADRALGHKLAAAWLEGAGEGDAMVLAEHTERGGEPLRAARHFVRAAAQALEGNDLAAAIDRAERGARAGAAGALLGELRLIQAEARRWRGENAEIAVCAREAADILEAGTAPWYLAVGELAAALGKLGRIDELVALGEEILARRDDDVSPDDLVVLCRGVVQLIYVGKYELGVELLDRIGGVRGGPQQTAAAPRDPRAIAQLCQARATWATVRGDVAGYRRETERSIESAERAGDLRVACLQRVNLGDAYLQLGGYAEAERTLREAAEVAARMGLEFVRVISLLNMGCALGCQGRLAEGREKLLAALAAPSAKGDRRVEIGAQIYLAIVHFLAGDLGEAELRARAASAASAEMPPIHALVLGVLSRVLVAKGDAAEALPVATEAMRLLESLGRIEAGEATVRLAYAEALAASGDGAGARDAIRAARDRLLARAEPIADPVWRESFLGRVHENADTLARAREWLAAERQSRP